MKRFFATLLTILALSPLAACMAEDAPEVTPSPSATVSPSPEAGEDGTDETASEFPYFVKPSLR